MLFFLIFSVCSQAGGVVGIGLLTQNMHKVSTNASAGKSVTGTAYFPELSAGWRFNPKGSGLYPSLGFTPFGKKSPDSGQSKSFLTIAVPWASAQGIWEWKLGPALQIYQIKSKGGSSVQKNGSSTATFYFPDATVATRNFYLDIGAALLAAKIRLEFDLLITGLLAQRFAANGLLRMNYVF